MAVRPRFSTEVEPFELKPPPGKKIGGAIAADYSPEGELIVLHQPNPPGQEIPGLDSEGDDNFGRAYGILHRFRAMPDGNLLLCCTAEELRRLRYLGTH